jgi:hypothetical protein
MANTYTLISSVTVGAGGAGTISFTSIPATYTDFLVKGSFRTNRADGSDWVSITLSSGGAYTQKTLIGDGSSAGSDSGFPSGMVTDGNTATSNTFGSFELYLPNYLSSNAKSFSLDSVSENNSTGAYAQLFAGLGAGTSAITSITFTPQYGTGFVQYSTAYIYGISNA